MHFGVVYVQIFEEDVIELLKVGRNGSSVRREVQRPARVVHEVPVARAVNLFTRRSVRSHDSHHGVGFTAKRTFRNDQIGWHRTSYILQKIYTYMKRGDSSKRIQ